MKVDGVKGECQHARPINEHCQRCVDAFWAEFRRRLGEVR